MPNPITDTTTAAGTRAHPRRGRRTIAPAVRARRDRLSRDDQGHPERRAIRAARRSPRSWAPNRSCSD